MSKTRIPRKLKKQQKKALAFLNELLPPIVGFPYNENTINVGHTVRVGKGKTDWYVETAMTHMLILRSPAGTKKNVLRENIDTLTKVS